MQSDPQDEQWVLPDRRDGEPAEPVRDAPGSPPDGAAETPDGHEGSSVAGADAVVPPAGGTTPPRMPAPPQMPTGGPPPSAWGSPPDERAPVAPAAVPSVSPRALGSSGPQEGSAEPHEAVEPENEEAQAGSSTEAPPASEAPASPQPQPSVAPAVQGDWLASVCPYLTSEDGTYRSAAPADGHRCTAQDPAATLPLAFQERFCLTDRHPRCEMYKFAQETDASGAIPVANVPPTDPPTPKAGSGAGGSGRPAWLAAVGIAVAVILMVVLALVMGSCSGGGGTDVDGQASAEPRSTEQSAATPQATPAPTRVPDPSATPDPEATPGEAGTAAEIVILYEIQPDEALRRISETFGISRNRIRRANPGLEELTPAELPGQIIEIPLAGDMTLEEAEALPGYRGAAP